MIELTEVTKLYKTVIGINEVTLKIEPGTYGLLGPNGSGKTTLINLILGQLRPTIGKVRLFGENPWRRSGLLRRVGLCPAHEVAFPRVTGREWVRFLTKMQGFSSAAAEKRAVETLELVKMTHAMDRPMRGYSLGMRQRTKLAQAIAHEPDLLILDEPFSGLDPVGRFEMTNFLKEWAQKGKSLILASHILHEVEAVNPSFLLISDGRLLASGSPEEVQEILSDSPATVQLRADRLDELASLLFLNCPIEEIKREDDRLIVSTKSAMQLRQVLLNVMQENGIQISEMSSTDDSLKTLFSTLMQIHRGETQKGTR